MAKLSRIFCPLCRFQRPYYAAFSPRNYKRNPFYGLVALGTIAGVTLDQITKTLARSMCMHEHPSLGTNEGTTVQLAHVGSQNTFACMLSVTHLPNGGVMLGALEISYPLVATAVFYATTVAGLAACAWLWNRQGASNCATKQRMLYRLCAASIATGIVSNLLDRIRLGYVIDWIYPQFYVKNAHVSAPVFNLADTYIATGIAVAMAGVLLGFLPKFVLSSADKRHGNARGTGRTHQRSG